MMMCCGREPRDKTQGQDVKTLVDFAPSPQNGAVLQGLKDKGGNLKSKLSAGAAAASQKLGTATARKSGASPDDAAEPKVEAPTGRAKQEMQISASCATWLTGSNRAAAPDDANRQTVMKTIEKACDVDLAIDPAPPVQGMKRLYCYGSEEDLEKAKAMMDRLASRCNADSLSGCVDSWAMDSEDPMEKPEVKFNSKSLGFGAGVVRGPRAKLIEDDSLYKPKHEGSLSVSVMRRSMMKPKADGRKSDGYAHVEHDEVATVEETKGDVDPKDFRSFSTDSSFGDTLNSYLRENSTVAKPGDAEQAPTMWREDRHGGAELVIGAGEAGACDEAERARVSTALKVHFPRIAAVTQVEPDSIIFRVPNAKDSTATTNQSAKKFCAALAEKGVVAWRDRGPSNYICLKVGSSAENDKFLEALPRALR